MLTVEEAKILLLQNTQLLSVESVELLDAIGRITTDNIFSPLDLPSFSQSAMDGYAVKMEVERSEIPIIIWDGRGEREDRKRFEVIGEIKAGDAPAIKIENGQAIRIFTGAPIPDGANCVVIQEKVYTSPQPSPPIKIGTFSKEREYIVIKDTELKQGDNIRIKGSIIKKGALALKKGMILNPAAIGFLASMGISKIDVYKKPIVSIIVTGNELEPLDNKNLQTGQIYESNSYTLLAALQQMSLNVKNIVRVKDEKEELNILLKQCITDSDVVILSGGISVGKYDLVNEALRDLGVTPIFYKVAQKPGKPLFFGKKENTLIFGLPGNPAATLVCFYEYILPSLKKMQGFTDVFLPPIKSKLLNSVKSKRDRAVFLKAHCDENGIVTLEGQDSNSLSSFSEANALLYLPLGEQNKNTGDEVEVHILPTK